jgi:hypothetical protein
MAIRDRREEMLARLFVICQSFDPAVVPLRRIYRNRTNISGKSGPAIVLMDGTEETPFELSARRAGVVAKLSALTMLPRIQLFDSGSSEEIGTKLNALRLQMIVRVQDDAQLVEIGGTSYGMVQYLGCEPEFDTGEKAEGRIDIKFAITYPLIGSEIRP